MFGHLLIKGPISLSSHQHLVGAHLARVFGKKIFPRDPPDVNNSRTPNQIGSNPSVRTGFGRLRDKHIKLFAFDRLALQDQRSHLLHYLGRHFWRHLGCFPLASKSPGFFGDVFSASGAHRSVHRKSCAGPFGGEVHWQLLELLKSKAEALTPFCRIHRKLPKIWDHSLDLICRNLKVRLDIFFEKFVGFMMVMFRWFLLGDFLIYQLRCVFQMLGIQSKKLLSPNGGLILMVIHILWVSPKSDFKKISGQNWNHISRRYTPENERLEPKNHPPEKGKSSSQPPFCWVQNVSFRPV